MTSFRVKNLTPFPFGVKLTSISPPQPEMVAILRGRFDLVQDGVMHVPEPQADLHALTQGPLSGDELSEDAEDLLGELIYPSDFGDFKPGADLILRGTCHPAARHSVTRCPISFEVGKWKKSLWVIGDRVWEESLVGPRATEPRPFDTMPLSYARAFGGADSDNPCGRGSTSLELPNIEVAEALIRKPKDSPPPAGFGPINPHWPGRAGKMGKLYGEEYKRTRAPYYAEDFDWSHFNAAPVDQQLKGYLKGDEELRLQNMHAQHAELKTRLPSLRIRVFVNTIEGEFREIPMSLDTLFVDTDESQACLTWRGRIAVTDIEFKDIKCALVVSEALETRPQPTGPYREALDAFEADPLGIKDELPKEEADLFFARMNEDKEAEAAATMALLKRDSPEMVERAEQEGIDLTPKEPEPSPPPVPIPVAPRVSLGLDTAQLESAIGELRKVDPAKAEAMEKKFNDPKLLAMDPNFRPPGAPTLSTDEPGPGANLAGRDFTEADLRGTDLSGADLSGAILTQANLSGVSLRGANLNGAMLFMANLEGADFSKADLSRINAANASMKGAILTGANLEHAYLGEADLQNAELDHVTGTYVFFTKANLKGASFRGAELEKADFEEASLISTSFEAARLPKALFHSCQGAQADFQGAFLQSCGFDGADLTCANFSGAIGPISAWAGSTLDGADFRASRFIGAYFTDLSAEGTFFMGGDFTDALFTKAVLRGADFSHAKLKSADLTRTSIDDAVFVGANLYDAKLQGAVGARADFTSANIQKLQR